MLPRPYRNSILAAVIATLLPISVFAQSAKAEGEVRRIDKDAGKITIRHGPVKEFDMQAMTMVFRTADPALLDRLKSGDKIHFTFEKIGGQFTLTSAETAP